MEKGSPEMPQTLLDALDGWSSVKSAELYGIDAWGQGYFRVTEDGYVAVNLKNAKGTVSIKLCEIVAGLHDRGMGLPLLLRFSDLLGDRLRLINETFEKAISEYGYQGGYRGVFPIKVNQQQQAVHDVVTFGAPYHHGLEAGSKAELIAALAYMRDPDAFLICNGYKDAEFIDLALASLKMGLQTILVLETPDELNLILERANALNIRPRMGIRVKLSSRVGGKWSESGGERSVFGLTPSQVIDAVDQPFRYPDKVAEKLGDAAPCHTVAAAQLNVQTNMGLVRGIASNASDIVITLRRKSFAVLKGKNRGENLYRLPSIRQCFGKADKLRRNRLSLSRNTSIGNASRVGRDFDLSDRRKECGNRFRSGAHQAIALDVDNLANGRHLAFLQFSARMVAQIPQSAALFGAHKGHCNAFCSRAAGSAYTMRVSRSVIRKGVIYDMRQPFNIDTARRDVSRHKNACFFHTEAAKDFFSLALGNVSVQGCRLVMSLVKLFRYGVGVGLCLAENQTVKIGSGVDQAHQRLCLVVLANQPVVLVGEHRLFRPCFFLHDFIFSHKIRSDRQNLRRHRRREHEAAGVGIRPAENRFDIFYKAHVEHFICFVQNKILDFGKIKGTALQMVDHTSRSTDDNLDAAPERAQLIHDGGSAVHGTGAGPGFAAERFDLGRNLYCQLSGRHQHERPGASLVRTEFLNHRQTERGGLSRTGSRLCDNIGVSVQQPGNREHLNRRRLRKTLGFHSREHNIVEPEVGKRNRI